jgi:ethanolamine utilization microcompartment shell protein EutL
VHHGITVHLAMAAQLLIEAVQSSLGKCANMKSLRAPEMHFSNPGNSMATAVSQVIHVLTGSVHACCANAEELGQAAVSQLEQLPSKSGTHQLLQCVAG